MCTCPAQLQPHAFLVGVCPTPGIVVDEGTGARKADHGKIMMELLPPEALMAIAEVFTYGAKKYDARNWERGFDWGRIYGALQRHLMAWWAGEDMDKETGYSHLAHAGCDLLMLLTYEILGAGTDDRPSTPRLIIVETHDGPQFVPVEGRD